LVQQKLLASASGGLQPLGGCLLQNSAAWEFDEHAWCMYNHHIVSYRAKPALDYTFWLFEFSPCGYADTQTVHPRVAGSRRRTRQHRQSQQAAEAPHGVQQAARQQCLRP
jgi:hypothetical protein